MPLHVDLEANRVFLYNEEVLLGGVEYQLLKVLWINKGRLVASATLLDAIWGDLGMTGDAHLLDATISRLRKKVGRNTITTRKGIGYGIL